MKIYIHIFTLGIQYDFVNKHLLYYFDFAKLIKKNVVLFDYIIEDWIVQFNVARNV